MRENSRERIADGIYFKQKHGEEDIYTDDMDDRITLLTIQDVDKGLQSGPNACRLSYYVRHLFVLQAAAGGERGSFRIYSVDPTGEKKKMSDACVV